MLVKNKTAYDLIVELEERGEVINCLNDRVFRSLFSSKDMIGILSYLIVCITDLSEEVCDNIDIVNPYEGSKNITLREMTHDLKVTIKNNTITLEMNQFNDRENIFRNSAHFHESIVKSLEASKHKDDISRYTGLTKEEIEKL